MPRPLKQYLGTVAPARNWDPNWQRTSQGTRIVKPVEQVVRRTETKPGSSGEPMWVQLPVWQAMPWFARRFQFPGPPYQTNLVAGAAAVNIVNYTVPQGRAAVVEQIEITTQQPIALPICVFQILRNGTPIPECPGVVGPPPGFTVDHPYTPVVARDIRLMPQDNFRITGINPGVADFIVFVRAIGYDFSTEDAGDMTWFYQG